MTRVQASRQSKGKGDKPKGQSLRDFVQACDDAHRLAKRRASSSKSSKTHYYKNLPKSQEDAAERQRRRRRRLKEMEEAEPTPPPEPSPPLPAPCTPPRRQAESLPPSSPPIASPAVDKRILPRLPNYPTTQDINEALRGISRRQREFVMDVLEAAQLERRKRLRYANDWNGIWEETYKEVAFTSKLDWDEMFDEVGIGSADEW